MGPSENELSALVESLEVAPKNLTEQLRRDTVISYLRGLKADPLYRAIERMKKNHYHMWKVLHELYLGERADPILLEIWRQEPEGSQGWRKAREHDAAIDLLLIATKG